MSIDRVIAMYPGFHFESELRAMNRTAAGVTAGVIVSIGSYRGQMDCALALHAQVPVYCIDPRRPSGGEDTPFGDADRQHWFDNANSLGLIPKLRPINLPSIDVAKIWQEPIGLLWIDGDHSLAVEDADAWIPLVMDGGIVAFHDANASAVIQAYTQRPDLVEIERANITVIFRKESAFEQFSDGVLECWVRKGPYNHDDKYVLGEVRSYAIGADPIRTFIDCGANIGAFSAWMAQQYPEAQGIAIEPEWTGFHALERNMAVCPHVMAVHGRVNYDPAPALLVIDPVNSGCHKILRAEDVPPSSYATEAPKAVTLEELMSSRGWTTLDLLKIDVEGSETDILMNASDDCLTHIRRVVGEFHAGREYFMNTIGARLLGLGFQVEAETDPQAHSTFVAINPHFSYAETPLDSEPFHDTVADKPKPKRPSSRAGKGRAK